MFLFEAGSGCRDYLSLSIMQYSGMETLPVERCVDDALVNGNATESDPAKKKKKKKRKKNKGAVWGESLRWGSRVVMDGGPLALGVQ